MSIVSEVSRWFEGNARSLPWRGAEPWHVVVSEFMLQQTPVARVLPIYDVWIKRWPIPSALAQEPVAEAVRHWGRLGYPRRAQRLHAVSVILDRDFDDQVPDTYEQLRELPGIGDYTAAAILAFAFNKRSIVLDTNVRRVLVRAISGKQWPSVAVSVAERELAAGLVPQRDDKAALWNAAVMELGALVCTSAKPKCDECPIANHCAWNQAGRPQSVRPHTTQTWHGTDRQCRGVILRALRESDSLTGAQLQQMWQDAEQFERCLASLSAEKFIEQRARRWQLA